MFLDSYPINPPSTEQRRLERLYDLARMVFADKIADQAEKKIMNKIIHQWISHFEDRGGA